MENIVKKDNELVSSTVFNKSHNYNNTSNKFDLKNFENSTINNFAEKIAEEIVIYLLSI